MSKVFYKSVSTFPVIKRKSYSYNRVRADFWFMDKARVHTNKSVLTTSAA